MPMESPSASARPEAFPAGLRVLVVDDDPTWLKILEKMLRKCSYEVTTCALAREALDMLRERKEKFDIVISDVNMPDMDGFKLLEHVGLEMDLPVIMMSVDGETSRVMKGVQHGACDYLLKPIRMKELRNIWQHVYRKKIHEVKDIESHDSNDDIQMMRNVFEDFDDRQLSGGSDVNSMRKRKDVDYKEHSDQDSSDPAAVKKARVVWSVDLHQKFVHAVNQIGFDKVGPKKILDLMNIPRLTRENVASHLQKYRLYLSRLQKQHEVRTFGGNMQSELHSKDHKLGVQSSIAMPESCVVHSHEEKSFGGNMRSDFSYKDLPEHFGYQSSLSMQQNSVASRYLCATQNLQAQSIIPNIQVNDSKTAVSLQVMDTKNAMKSDAPDSQGANNVSQLGVAVSFKGTKPNVDCKSLEPTILKHQSWNGSIPVVQFMQNPKQNHDAYPLPEGHLHLPQPGQKHKVVDHLYTPPSFTTVTCNDERDTACLAHIKPFNVDYRSCHLKPVAPVSCTIDSVTVQVGHGIVNSQEIGAVCETNASTTISNSYFDQPNSCSLIPPLQESTMKNGMDFVSLPEDFHLYSLQGYGCIENISLNDVEVFKCNDSTSASGVHGNMYDGFGFSYEYPYDSMEYPLLDDCLFT